MRNPIPRVRRRVRRLVRGDVPLKVGSYVAPKGLRPFRADEIAATDAFHVAYYDSWEWKPWTRSWPGATTSSATRIGSGSS
jgi:hypothetical protein